MRGRAQLCGNLRGPCAGQPCAPAHVGSPVAPVRPGSAKGFVNPNPPEHPPSRMSAGVCLPRRGEAATRRGRAWAELCTARLPSGSGCLRDRPTQRRRAQGREGPQAHSAVFPSVAGNSLRSAASHSEAGAKDRQCQGRPGLGGRCVRVRAPLGEGLQSTVGIGQRASWPRSHLPLGMKPQRHGEQERWSEQLPGGGLWRHPGGPRVLAMGPVWPREPEGRLPDSAQSRERGRLQRPHARWGPAA